MNKGLLGTAAVAVMALSAPAMAATVFYSDFENVPGAPGFGGYTTVATADGFTGGAGGIELQNHVAGNPAATGGNIFVELDTFMNSSMSRTIAAGGVYDLSFLYSPRPGIAATSNGIDVLLNGVALLPTITGVGGADTMFSTMAVSFAAAAGSTLTFQAVGTSDSLGGYLDNIKLSTSAVPEPASWAMMIAGVGLMGAALRRRSVATVRYA